MLTSDEPAEAVATRPPAAITARFETIVPVVVRTDAARRRYAAGSPFPDTEAARPNLLLLCLPIAPLAAAGSPVTARNWTTVLAINAMLEAA